MANDLCSHNLWSYKTTRVFSSASLGCSHHSLHALHRPQVLVPWEAIVEYQGLPYCHTAMRSFCYFTLYADAQVYVPWEAVAGNLQEDIGMQDDLEFAEADFGSMDDLYEPDRHSRRRLLAVNRFDWRQMPLSRVWQVSHGVPYKGQGARASLAVKALGIEAQRLATVQVVP
eukprot:1138209-Pelagomonas_calceolata.AAC.2